ncbi:hypothetical protein BJ742DRAFT_911586 [Cladochytrium replicatum]|nr:hypothetical protein BJ742DRAFT_911586 [Cladochytrium replicatum]
MMMMLMNVAGMDQLCFVYAAVYKKVQLLQALENDANFAWVARAESRRTRKRKDTESAEKKEADGKGKDSEAPGNASDEQRLEVIPKVFKSSADKKLQVYNEKKKIGGRERLRFTSVIKRNGPLLLVFGDKATAETEGKNTEQAIGGENVKHYIFNDDSKTLHCPGRIVICTNVGGRGTDYELSAEAIQNSRLHTILTFYAESTRVVSQAFGHSARTGKPGSGVLIAFNGSWVVDNMHARITELEEKTAELYEQSLSEQLKNNVPLNEACDGIFTAFSQLYQRVCEGKDFKKRNTVDQFHYLQAICDCFGLFVEEWWHDSSLLALSPAELVQACEEKFSGCKLDITTGLEAEQVISNPPAQVLHARDLMARGLEKPFWRAAIFPKPALNVQP